MEKKKSATTLVALERSEKFETDSESSDTSDVDLTIPKRASVNFSDVAS